MPLLATLADELSSMSAAGTLKRELPLKGPQGAVVDVEGVGEVIMLTSNNYLGLADHPAILEAAESDGNTEHGTRNVERRSAHVSAFPFRVPCSSFRVPLI